MQLQSVLIDALQEELHLPIISFQAISGGDINQAFRLETPQQSFFLKYNQYPQGAEMLRTERAGLEHLATAEVMSVPKPIAQGTRGSYHFLVLEDWSGRRPAPNFWPVFGQSLAALHRQTHDHFGLAENNFIAKLPQSNRLHTSWSSFYWEERLKPLTQQGYERGLLDSKDLRGLEQVGKRLPEYFLDRPPSLLHGDLWSGNFMVAPSGQAGLIDPAIYYGHREVDLAMTRLFGGFQEAFYQAYQEAFPLDIGWEERISLCQLYPLLVHLLLFGRSYRSAVKEVITAYQ
ncbi:MAG: fructosamine kinase family protein [Saprospiraceae bacterium]|nr:fructosamine kinase family protein [Saprospiraceae bacterium]